MVQDYFQFYETFKHTKYPMSLIGIVAIFELVSFVGVVGNLTIVVATYKSK